MRLRNLFENYEAIINNFLSKNQICDSSRSNHMPWSDQITEIAPYVRSKFLVTILYISTMDKNGPKACVSYLSQFDYKYAHLIDIFIILSSIKHRLFDTKFDVKKERALWD